VNTDTPAAPAGHRAESRFEDRLLTAILADYDHLAAAPARPARPSRPAAGSVRRAAPALIAGAVAAAVAVTAAGLTMFASHAPGTPGHAQTAPQHHATQPHTQTQIQTAAYVVHHMKDALAANTAVLVTLDHAPDAQTGRPVIDRIWSSGTSSTSRIEDLDPAGNPVSGYVVTTLARKTISIQINYQSRTWTKTIYPFGTTSRTAGPAPQPAPLPVTPAQQAAQLRAEVTAGQVRLVGPATIDGQRAIELRQGSAATGLLDMWVSPTTYLPIATIGTAPGVSQASDQAIRDDYQWLPGTPAHLRLLTAAAAIPTGFSRVPPQDFRN
jgi:hypothetical protein